MRKGKLIIMNIIYIILVYIIFSHHSYYRRDSRTSDIDHYYLNSILHYSVTPYDLVKKIQRQTVFQGNIRIPIILDRIFVDNHYNC